MEKKTKKEAQRFAFKSKKTYNDHVKTYLEEYMKNSNDELLNFSKDLLVSKSKAIENNESQNKIQILSEKYEAVVRALQLRNLYDHTFNDITDKFKYYPDYSNINFNKEIYSKKEFYLHKTLSKNQEKDIESVSQKLCDPLFDSITGEKISDKANVMFNLTNSQKFLKSFMSPNTPYNSLLIYHGTGVGKTCTSISIAEQYSKQLKEDGKKIVILLNQSIKENFVKNIFNIQKLREGMPYYQCTGMDYLKMIPNYDSLPLEIVQKKILKIIKSKYSFYGYQKFANVITELENRIKETYSDSTYHKVFEKKIKELFSDTVMIIDEAHNIKEGETVKQLPPILDKVVSIADNMKLLLLSATPMFDNATEIIWLVNLLLKNDKRPTLSVNEYFDSNGKFLEDKINLFKKKTKGLISYVRGENPYRFPEKLYPSGKNILLPDQCPRKTWDNKPIKTEDLIKELVLVDCKMTGFQQEIYDKMLSSKELFGAFKQPGIMCSDIVFPEYSSNRKSNSPRNSPNNSPRNSPNNSDDEDFNIGNYIGDTGFENVAVKSKISDRIIYKIKNNIFSQNAIHNYSTKINTLINNIKKSEGIVFIYSQFINSGVIPIALALENAGYSKYGGSLLEKEIRPNLGKYIIISGSEKNAYKNYLKIENGNKDGNKVKIIIGSEAASEGLDFRFIRTVHILEPWFHLNKLDQVVGRAIRNCSHIDLPYEKRNVIVYFYTANSSNPKHKDCESLDISIYREAEKKARNMADVEYILKTNAVDCAINKVNNIFFNDINKSRKCNYRNCDYKCDGIDTDNLDNSQLNYDTLNFEVLNDIINDVIKIIKVGNNKDKPLFTKSYIYSLDEILKYVDNDVLCTLLGLHKIIVTKEIIIDMYGRNCCLEYKNGMYVLVPKNMDKTLYTSNDLRVKPFKRTKKITLSDDLLKYISENKEVVKIKKNTIKKNNKGNQLSTNTKKKNIVVDVLKRYSYYNSLLNDIIYNSSIEYLEIKINDNHSKVKFDEDNIRELFIDNKYMWLDYLEPNRKRAICEVLIVKYYRGIRFTSDEQEIFNNLYNIMRYNDVYFNDISFKGNKEQIWGYKLAVSSKVIEYIRYDNSTEQFVKATSDEVKSIAKSFIKKTNQEKVLPPFFFIGYMELRPKENLMKFKIRDKRNEGKKGTQIKTGSVCNNDGMKKKTIIEYIRYILQDENSYKHDDGEELSKTDLPSKDLLCIQLETYLRSFDKENKKFRYFYNYEETIEYKINEKNITKKN